MRDIDRVIVTDMSFWRMAALVQHRKRRIRKKYERTLFVRWPSDGVVPFIERLRAVHNNGRPFTPKGVRSAVRIMRKVGYHEARALQR